MTWFDASLFIISVITFIAIISSYIYRFVSYPDGNIRDMNAIQTVFLDLRECNTSTEVLSSILSTCREYGKPARIFTFVDYHEKKDFDDIEYPSVLDYGVAIGFNKTGNSEKGIIRQVSYILDTEQISEDEIGQEVFAQKRRNKINKISIFMSKMADRMKEYNITDGHEDNVYNNNKSKNVHIYSKVINIDKTNKYAGLKIERATISDRALPYIFEDDII